MAAADQAGFVPRVRDGIARPCSESWSRELAVQQVEERPWRENAQRSEGRMAVEGQKVGVAGHGHVSATAKSAGQHRVILGSPQRRTSRARTAQTAT